MEQIKNIIFDLGGVLVGLDAERCRRAFRHLGMNAIADIIDPCYPAEMIGQLERGDIDYQEACDKMRTIANAPDITNEQIEWAYGEFLIDTPVEKLRMLEQLRKKGYKTYVLSNNNPISMKRVKEMFKADGHDMDYYFDKIYLSYQLRELKPNEVVFRRMMADSGMKPEESLFIDDGQRNVDTALRLGFGVYMPAEGEDFSHLFSDMLG